jgi:hypothetical protein
MLHFNVTKRNRVLKMTKVYRFVSLLIMMILLVSACNGDGGGSPRGSIRGEIKVDGETRTFSFDTTIAVQEVLRQENIVLSELDRITPSRFTPIQDGMTITIVRVTEENECDTKPIPYDTDEYPSVALEPGERILVEEGENGERLLCERIYSEDGVVVSRSTSSNTVVQEPKNQIVYVGVDDTLDPVSIEGTIAYLSRGQAWVIEGTNSNRRPLPIQGQLDGRVFDLSPDGRQLLYTKQTDNPEDSDFSNELWVLPDLRNGEPVQLQQIDILSAQWLSDGSVAYTSASAGGGFQGWTAYNDLWVMNVNDIADIDSIIEQNSAGSFAFWGTTFKSSPTAQLIAYSKADGVGLVDIEDNDFGDFVLRFPHFNAATQDQWVWQPKLSWSPDGQWVTTTVHGPPVGDEPAEDSVVFDVAIFEATEDDEEPLVIRNFIERAGIWAQPAYSPQLPDGSYQIAYFQARDGLNSVGTEYDLMVMDRDGSNARKIYPADGEPGFRPITTRNGEFVWSPSGRQILATYQGDLWVVEISTGFAQQLTNDGQAESPRWTD